jgi:hypothetical protein
MKPNHYAVVVGIDRYPGMPEKPLQYVRNDAIAFYEWLISPSEGGVEHRNAKIILATEAEQSSEARRPLRWEVIEFLTDIHIQLDKLGEKEWSENRLYVYLAGHGVAPADGRGALLFADARPDHNWGDMLDLDACERFYERFPFFKEIVLIGDFCRDIDKAIPPVGELTFGKYYGKVRPTRRVRAYGTTLSQQSGEPKGTLEALPAITTVPPELPSKRKARGFFTRAVLEGLRGGATPDPISGIIDVDRLDAYVKPRIRQLSGSSNQEPDITYANAKDLVLVQYPVPKYTVKLLVPEDLAEPIDVVLWGRDRVMASWAPGEPLTWNVSLPAANYEAVTRSGYTFENGGFFKVRSSPTEAAGHEDLGGAHVVAL